MHQCAFENFLIFLYIFNSLVLFFFAFYVNDNKNESLFKVKFWVMVFITQRKFGKNEGWRTKYQNLIRDYPLKILANGYPNLDHFDIKK